MKQPTMPSKTLLQGASYVPAAHTDIKARFDAIRAEQAASKQTNVQQLQRRRK
jgi:hypothetical protein